MTRHHFTVFTAACLLASTTAQAATAKPDAWREQLSKTVDHSTSAVVGGLKLHLMRVPLLAGDPLAVWAVLENTTDQPLPVNYYAPRCLSLRATGPSNVTATAAFPTGEQDGTPRMIPIPARGAIAIPINTAGVTQLPLIKSTKSGTYKVDAMFEITAPEYSAHVATADQPPVWAGKLTATLEITLTPAPVSPAEKPALYIRHTAGWGAGVLAEFTAAKDGQFVFTTKQECLAGKIPAAALAAFILTVSSAPEGPAAEDAGYVELKWTDPNGKAGSRSYSLPNQAPCQILLQQMEDLARKHVADPAAKTATSGGLTLAQAQEAAAKHWLEKTNSSKSLVRGVRAIQSPELAAAFPDAQFFAVDVFNANPG